MDDRIAQLNALRARRTDSATQNRQALITETNLKRSNAKTIAKLERKKAQLEAIGDKAEALETGEDLSRKRNWDYSIEDNDNWDKKQARKERRADFSFTDYDDIARRKYKKDLDKFKPDTAAYNLQREAANESNSLALIPGSTSAAAEDLYRDANSFIYADHKPSEDAIDRVIGKINIDLDKRQKRSRVRKNEEEGDITYINEKNKHFNKKLERFYGEHTKQTKEAFERGTAL